MAEDRLAKGDFRGLIASGRNNTELADPPKIAVPAEQGSAERECSCGDPKVVLVKRKAESLLTEFKFCVMIRGCDGDWFEWHRGEERVRLFRQFRSPPAWVNLRSPNRISPRTVVQVIRRSSGRKEESHWDNPTSCRIRPPIAFVSRM